MPRACLVVAFAAISSLAVAQEASFEERLERGNALLRKGDFAGALAIFDELQVEEPNSPALHFSRGCALYEKALSEDGEAGASEAALNAAKEAFERAEAGAKGTLKTDAAYNRANTMAQIAKKTAPGQDPKSATQKFHDSIQSYEELLRSHPDHDKANHNLDHIRYALKRYLQQPPPPPQEQQSGEQQERDDQQQQQQDQQQQPNQGDQKNDDSQPQDPQQGEQEKNEDNQQQSSSDQENRPMQGQDKAILNGQDLKRENIEALLESLEDRDKSEQRDIRQGPRDHRLREEWW